VLGDDLVLPDAGSGIGISRPARLQQEAKYLTFVDRSHGIKLCLTREMRTDSVPPCRREQGEPAWRASPGRTRPPRTVVRARQGQRLHGRRCRGDGELRPNERSTPRSTRVVVHEQDGRASGGGSSEGVRRDGRVQLRDSLRGKHGIPGDCCEGNVRWRKHARRYIRPSLRWEREASTYRLQTDSHLPAARVGHRLSTRHEMTNSLGPDCRLGLLKLQMVRHGGGVPEVLSGMP
jgi:hypothetical protein